MGNFREGDRVSIKGVISSNHVIDGKIKVDIEPYHSIFVPAEEVAMERPNIMVGDAVCCPSADHDHATVLAIAGEHLWVSFGDGVYTTWQAASVQRVDPEPAGEPAEAAP